MVVNIFPVGSYHSVYREKTDLGVEEKLKHTTERE